MNGLGISEDGVESSQASCKHVVLHTACTGAKLTGNNLGGNGYFHKK